MYVPRDGRRLDERRRSETPSSVPNVPAKRGAYTIMTGRGRGVLRVVLTRAVQPVSRPHSSRAANSRAVVSGSPRSDRTAGNYPIFLLRRPGSGRARTSTAVVGPFD